MTKANQSRSDVMRMLFRIWWRKVLCKKFGHSLNTDAWGNENRGGVIKICSRCGYWEKIEEYNRWNHPEQSRVIERGYTDPSLAHSHI
jgi:hypothetical protein